MSFRRPPPPADLITPQDVAAIVALVDSGGLTDRLARQVVEGVIAGEGTPAQVVESRGLQVVSDDGALIEAIDAALAAQLDVLEKIREGKVQAAGAVIGAVMKSMGARPMRRACVSWCSSGRRRSKRYLV